MYDILDEVRVHDAEKENRRNLQVRLIHMKCPDCGSALETDEDGNIIHAERL